MNPDIAFMLEAIQLAKKGWYTTHPNPRVGCVLVKQQQIIGRGWHQYAGQGHAEVNALQQAGENARGATAYVTLEPCSHFGKTPPCSDALIDAGIKKVVVAMQDPNPLVAGSGIERLQKAGIDTYLGVLEAEARSLNYGFIQRMQTNRPFIRCKMGVSLDGQTALASGASQWITGTDARRDVQRLRAESSAIVTGIGTVLADDPALNVRDERFPYEQIQPARVVLDSRLRISPQAKMLSLPGKTYVLTQTASLQKSKVNSLTQQAVEIIGINATSQGLDLEDVVKQLADLQFNQVLLETGPTLSGAMMQAGLLDELVIYMAPKLMGSEGRGLFHLPAIEKMADCIDLQIKDIRSIGNDVRMTITIQQ